MPPVKKFNKENIILSSRNIVLKEGIKNLNARRIAKELNSSVQPIFHNFSNMEELTKEVYNSIYDKYKEVMKEALYKDSTYKEFGLQYIRFAKEYPEYFKVLFMSETKISAKNMILEDEYGDKIIKSGQKLTGFTYEEQMNFHIKVWTLTHGLACFVATNTVKFTMEEISEILGSSVCDMYKGYMMRKENEK